MRCNVFATFHPLSPVKLRVYSSQNDNLCESREQCKRVQIARVVFTQQRAFLYSFIGRQRTSQDVSRPFGTFVLEGLCLFGKRTMLLLIFSA